MKPKDIVEQLKKHIEMESLFGVTDIPEKKQEKIPEEKVKTLESFHREIGNCQKCALHKTRTNLIFGEGSDHADIVFVGEAPGEDEDIMGRPFVGKSGQLLTKIIENGMKIKRSDVYICNVLKCRPPGNRNPLPEEIEKCEQYLIEQLKIIKPKVICTLGKFASQTLLKTETAISRLRGSFHDYHGIPLMPTFHPAYLLRNPGEKKKVWQDIQMIMKKIAS